MIPIEDSMPPLAEAARAFPANGTAPPKLKLSSRDDVLEQCKRDEAAWNEKPGRNIILLFDGTGNILGNHHDTNVVKLMRVIDKTRRLPDGRAEQLVYYDPGVGSSNQFPASSVAGNIRQKLFTLGGLALGSGAFQNVAEAYEFLVHHYEHNDRLYLFGFSRGAFTARALGGLLNTYGLVQPTGLPMLPLMVRNYFAEPPKVAKQEGIKETKGEKKPFNDDVVVNFSLLRRPLIHFVGVWDTVETIGSGLAGGVKITNAPTIDDKRFVHVRHAVSIHETREKYRPRLYTDPAFSETEKQQRSFVQEWFPGVHSDVGGSYKRDGLSVAPLQWIADAAATHGLKLTQHRFEADEPGLIMHDQTYESPYWAWTGIAPRPRGPGDGLVHNIDRHMRQPEATPRKNFMISRAAWSLPLVVLALAADSIWYSFVACGSTGWRSTLAAIALQFFVPWQAHLNGACDVRLVGTQLRWDLFLLAAYCLWLPFIVTWATRRMVRPAVAAGTAFPQWLVRLKWVLLAFFVAAFSEHVAAVLLIEPESSGFAAKMGRAYAATVENWTDIRVVESDLAWWRSVAHGLVVAAATVCTAVKIWTIAIIATAVIRGAMVR